MKTDTMCADTACDRGAAERPRYYARQLITSDDLTLEQDYFRNKLRLHNRMLHGWGVVCGAQVCLVPKKNGTSNVNGNGNGNAPTEFEPWKVYVKPGYILSPCGDEINIDCGRVIDLRTSGTSGVTGEPCVDAVDPWCVEVFERDSPDELFVALHGPNFNGNDFVGAAQVAGAAGAVVDREQAFPLAQIIVPNTQVLNHCPHEHVDGPIFDDLFEEAEIPACPEPPDDPWVGLARVELDPDGVITKIENCACRRMVLSHASFWWNCEAAHQIENVEDAEDLVPGEERVIRIEANRPIPAGTRVEVGPGVVVKAEGVKVAADNDRVLEVPIKVEQGAKAGVRQLALRFPNEQRAVRRNALQIRAAAEPAQPDTAAPTDKTNPSKKSGRKATRDTAPLADTLPDK